MREKSRESVFNLPFYFTNKLRGWGRSRVNLREALALKMVLQVGLLVALTARWSTAIAQDQVSNQNTVQNTVQSTVQSSAQSSVPLPQSTSATKAPAKENTLFAKTNAQLMTILIGRSIEDQIVNAKWMGTSFELVVDQEFQSWLKAHLDMNSFFATGSFSNLYTQEGHAPSGFLLTEASLEVDPFSFMSFKGGVLFTEFSDIHSSFQGAGFPGARAALHFKNETLSTELWTSQVIPTSDTAEVKSAENGITSRLSLVGGNLKLGDAKSLANLKLGLTYFDFIDLTSSAAVDSQYLGNTVTLTGSQARFNYDFKGWETSGSTSIRLGSRTRIGVDGSYLKNPQAPETANLAYSYVFKLTRKFGLIDVIPSFGYFYNESDSLPATYSRLNYSYNNRLGTIAGLATVFTKQKITAFARWLKADEIEDRPFTADRNIVTIGVEADYDIL